MAHFPLSATLVALVCAAGALGHLGPITELPITNGWVSPDGFERMAVLPNNQFPGPIIAGNKGDNFQINVHDQLTNGTMNKTTTIHWHGIFQHTTNWADGPAFVTQCPIAPGNSFLYDFTVPDQAGTFWYHSHESLQYCDGLRGPFIVYDPDDPHKSLYDVDDDSTVITLADWYHVPGIQVSIPAVSDSVLINGLGRVAGDNSSPLSVITVQQGLRYRFRLISVSCDPFFNFTIDSHSMTVIEADGVNTQALPDLDSIQIFSSQRYSFVLEANQPIDNYWIRAAPEPLAGFGQSDPPTGLAILRYEGAPAIEPNASIDDTPTSTNPLAEVNLHPLTNPEAPGGVGPADVYLNLNFSFTNPKFYVNNYSFTPPTVPVLLQILSGAYTAQELMPEGSVYTLPPNKVIQISMPGGVVGVRHPLHLHGHAFSVLRSAGDGTSELNYVNPVQRDTVNIGLLGDNVTIRFETNNPGPWFLHCHIDFHLNAGFAVVMAEDTYDTPRVDYPPPAWDELCPTFDKLPVSDY